MVVLTQISATGWAWSSCVEKKLGRPSERPWLLHSGAGFVALNGLNMFKYVLIIKQNQQTAKTNPPVNVTWTWKVGFALLVFHDFWLGQFQLIFFDLGKFHHDRSLFSRSLGIMVRIREIIPFYGPIQVSEFESFKIPCELIAIRDCTTWFTGDCDNIWYPKGLGNPFQPISISWDGKTGYFSWLIYLTTSYTPISQGGNMNPIPPWI